MSKPRKPRSDAKMYQLPKHIQDGVNERLINNNMSYADIIAWLAEQGYPVSQSAQRIADDLEKTKHIIEIIGKKPDLDTTEATSAILKSGLLQKISTAEEEFNDMPIEKAGKADPKHYESFLLAFVTINISTTVHQYFVNISPIEYRHRMRHHSKIEEVVQMLKKNFVSMIMGTIGGILFAVGMCMCLLPEWNAFTQGVVVACVGLVVLIAMLIVRRKMEGKPAIQLNGKAIGTVALGVVGALVLGVGMCMTMVWDMMVLGIVVGIVGIVLLLCLMPVIKGLK